jgi:hypothetical protein
MDNGTPGLHKHRKPITAQTTGSVRKNLELSTILQNPMNKLIQRLGISTLALLASSGSVLAQSTGFDGSASANADMQAHAAGAGFAGLVWLAVVIFMLVAMWKIFTKAGQPGWASLVPIYNAYILCKVAGKPGWWVLLLFVPLANLVFAIMLTVAVAKSFGKGTGFAVGMILLPFVFYPMLGFGSATYQGPAAQ